MTTLATTSAAVEQTPGTSATPAAPAASTGDPGVGRTFSLLGGAALALGPLLIVGGTLTSPPQASGSRADYIASLAADPALTHLSASLFHYGWVALTFGFLAAVGLVRGARGRTLALVGGIGGSLGALQMSGLLLADWSDGAAGRIVPLDQAVAILEAMDGSVSMAIWLSSAKVLAIVFPVLLFLGLARAGVVSWWIAPLIAGSMLVGALLLFLVGGVLGGVLGVVVSLVCYLPAFVAAARLVERGRTA
ncbi:hypothetical protein [Microlunatus flavus]|uniref:DUF4386 family protein n=1 Tax=Microlunatus flavus TaxID=1036181 RepID=A0A1H8YZZ2_9ACTN|nr:hypothetical protein [Microlunatus flavus]SEP57754.1 hypothetical protein SAMN05421756_10133 [Microlunatus flavus]